MVGGEDDIRACARHLGSFADEQLELDRSVFDFRRMFVSNPKIAGLPVGELCLAERYGAVATRVRRGDQDLLADEATVLELGDRVRVVAPRERMPEVTALFGDSFKALSEIDVISFALGIGLGLLVGAIPIPLPTGTTFKLGFAGGPLLVGLALGLRDRTGPLVWNLPYNANLTLRQLGLVLFLAGVGLRSGYAFVSTLRGGGGLSLLLAGAGVTTTVTVATLWVGHRVLKIPMGVLTGMLAGIQTQPAVLAFANEQTRHDLPGVGYATVYPVTTIAKIVLAQVLLALLRP